MTVDNQEFLIVTVWVIYRHKASEKVTLSVSLDDFYKVIVQLLAVLGLPVIVSLVNRNDKPLVRTFHVFDELTF